MWRPLLFLGHFSSPTGIQPQPRESDNMALVIATIALLVCAAWFPHRPRRVSPLSEAEREAWVERDRRAWIEAHARAKERARGEHPFYGGDWPE